MSLVFGTSMPVSMHLESSMRPVPSCENGQRCNPRCQFDLGPPPELMMEHGIGEHSPDAPLPVMNVEELKSRLSGTSRATSGVATPSCEASSPVMPQWQ